jgi:crotonobetainyl-CoA:carnitine CoA-transferase CaiB-like acyl-CoA transferase
MGDASPRRRNQADLPAEGVRVLDLTRVIAGPVCTRFMAALGADVLRVDPPRHPDIRFGAVADTLLGKRSSLVDFAAPDGLATLHRLLDQADVVVHGYRPGALDLFGLRAEPLAERHPGLVVVYLDAWGYSGPWAGRRGFDSIVQAPSGIAMGESGDGGEPGALPCQLLDHGTGYLAAAAVSDGLRRQAEQGGTHVRTLSLGRTAAWLTSTRSQAVPASGVPDGGLDPEPWLVELDSAGGPVSAVAPPGHLGARPLLWRSPLTGYGTDPAAWS